MVAPGDSLAVRIRFLATIPGNYDGVLLLGSAYCDDVPVSATAYAGVDDLRLERHDSWATSARNRSASETTLDITFRNTGDY